MQISTKDWKNYIERLSSLDKKAGQMMTEWIQKNGFSDTDALIDFAYAVATKYGEGSAALAAEMYDALAEVSGKMYEAAEVAPTPTRNEVAKTVNGTLKWSKNPSSVSNSVSRLVKRTGADTMLNNARRDGAQFAWVPNGDTCAFCITLASRGWQYMSDKAMRNGHAEHIHANCDCTYAVRFDNKSGVKGYDPQKYADMYYGAEGNTPDEKINAIRRIKYQQNKDRINAQKRAAYAMRRDATLNKDRDPIFDIFGEAEQSHPEELNSILDEAKGLGVSVKEDPNRMAYCPGVKSGEPGQLIISREDSIGAWRHERQHMVDDANDGFPGLAGIMDVERREKMEYNAYRIEIKMAREAGREDVVSELKRLCKEEIEEIGGQWDEKRLE